MTIESQYIRSRLHEILGTPVNAEAFEELVGALADVLTHSYSEEFIKSRLGNPLIRNELVKLAGRTVQIDKTLISFSGEGQFGDISVGNIAGRDQIIITVNQWSNPTHQRTLKAASIKPSLMHDYLSYTYNMANSLNSGELATNHPNKPMELAAVFTMLRIQNGQTVIDALFRCKFSILLGEPGGGKSTVTAFLTLSLIEAQHNFIVMARTDNTSRLSKGWLNRVSIASSLPIPNELRCKITGLWATMQPPLPIRIRLKDVYNNLWEGLHELKNDWHQEDLEQFIHYIEQLLTVGQEPVQELYLLMSQHILSQKETLQDALSKVEQIEGNIKKAKAQRHLLQIDQKKDIKHDNTSNADSSDLSLQSLEAIESQIEKLSQEAAKLTDFINEVRFQIVDNEKFIEQILSSSAILLLDGFDEVPNERLSIVKKLITDAVRRFACCRVIVTCRTFDYKNNLDLHFSDATIYELKTFNDADKEEFISRWYRELVRTGRRPLEEAELKRQNLMLALRERNEIRALAQTPLLLALITLVHTEEGELPSARAILYHRCVRLLLSRWRPILHHSVEMREDRLLLLASELGYLAHLQEATNPAVSLGLTRSQIRDASFRFYEKSLRGAEPRRLIESEVIGLAASQRFLNSNGLLLDIGNDTYRFAHRTFQEFLAGYYLSAGDSRRKLVLEHAQNTHWRIALILMAGYGAREGNIDYILRIIEALLNRSLQEVMIAGEMLAEIGREPLIDRNYDDLFEEDGTWYRLVLLLSEIAFSSSSTATFEARIQCAKLADLLGDIRPELDWAKQEYWSSRIEPGWFMMGAGKEAFRYYISRPFSMAKYPVTNSQYAVFLNSIPNSTVHLYRPNLWSGNMYESGYGNHPVSGIRLRQAYAFAKWVDDELKKRGLLSDPQKVRLPTEPEWERVAAFDVKGVGSKRFYPWDNSDRPAADRNLRANTYERKAEKTTAVGMFPMGRTDSGVEELAGNVWEWCSTKFMSYPLPRTIDPEDILLDDSIDEGAFAIRGGSWNDSLASATCSYRIRSFASNHNIGFRLVCEHALDELSE